MKLKEVLDKTIVFFKEKKIETARLDAELIFANALKLERIQLYLKFDQPLEESELNLLRELVRRRAQGEPVAYILGYRDFFGYRFEVNSSTLIPRPETEHIIEEVLNWSSNHEDALKILDLGCGSGAIGLSLLKKLPNARLLAIDISEEALQVAEKNSKSLGVFERTHFVCADAGNLDLIVEEIKEFFGYDSKIDIVVSNPPYIAKEDPAVELNVKKYEPHRALFAVEDGLYFLRNWSGLYAPFISEEALMLMEMGCTQGASMRDHFNKLEIFNEVRVIKDLSGLDRIICGVKHG